MSSAIKIKGKELTTTGRVDADKDENEITATTLGLKRGIDIVDIDGAQKTSYGVQEIVSNTAYVRAAPVYGLIPSNFREFSADGGSTGVENREFKTSTGTTIYGYGAIQSFRSLALEYGQTGLTRFCARFPDSVANSWQGVGLLTITDEISFGMNGTEFGVWHRYGGEVEVRTIQLTVGASGAENATVTVNGTAYVVAITSGTVQQNARTIANYLNTNATGYAAEQLNDTIYISALSDGAKSDTWSYSSTGTSAGTVTRVTTGVTKTSNFVAQSDFSGSVFSDFDHTKGNLYSISYGAGYSDIDYRIFDPSQKRFVTAHEIINASDTTRVTINNPALRAGIYSTSVGSTTDISTYCSFISAFAQGDRNATRNPRGFSSTKSIATTATNVLTIRNKRIYNGKINQAEIVPISLTVANEGNKSLIVEVRTAATVAGTTNFQSLGTNLIVETEVAGTTVSSDGRLITSIVVAPTDSKYIDLKALEIRIPPTLTLVVSARQLTGGSASSVTASLSWQEDI
ncbi:hypothetical protein KDA08_05625 [Candidatus Saccharibacteria bacterium]|nr:hypothetical protein [Candidatus Saccharibacteria bacterium]